VQNVEINREMLQRLCFVDNMKIPAVSTTTSTTLPVVLIDVEKHVQMSSRNRIAVDWVLKGALSSCKAKVSAHNVLAMSTPMAHVALPALPTSVGCNSMPAGAKPRELS